MRELNNQEMQQINGGSASTRIEAMYQEAAAHPQFTREIIGVSAALIAAPYIGKTASPVIGTLALCAYGLYLYNHTAG